MQGTLHSLSLLSAMITPAVLISACGTPIFYGCVMLIAETRLALRSVNSEMEFTLMLRRKYQERRAIMLEAREEIERSG